jgi:DNA replication protein DnaC
MYLHRTERLGACVPPLYEDASFDNFAVPGPENPVARREWTSVLLTVKGWVRDFPNQKRPGLLLIGFSGTGKTHLAAAAFNALIRNNVRGLFYDYQDLAERLALGARDGSGSVELDLCRSVDLLFLDDIGSQRSKDWMVDATLSLLKSRCNHRKPLIATTSLADADAGLRNPGDSPLHVSYERTLGDVIGPNARSRLFEMCTIIKLPNVEDYRIKRARAF